MLKELIGFRTVSRESNLGLIEYVRDYLKSYGIRPRFTYDSGGGKANLFATLGEARPGGLVLSGHTDVVPVAGQNWTNDPFSATLKDRRIYGRGAADMKGFIAAALLFVPRFLERAEIRLLHLALSFDEEIGCRGIPVLLEDIASLNLNPIGCVVGEPTEMRIAVGHKGASAYRCRVTGHAAHSARASAGVNAIHYAGKLVAELCAIGTQLEATEPRHPGFEVPYTTVQTTIIRGGLATNIIPAECEFTFDVRHLATTHPDEVLARVAHFAKTRLLPEMQHSAPQSDITFERIGAIPAFDAPIASPFVQLMHRLIADTQPPVYVDFGSEAPFFARAGIPSVICGPGSIAQAHQPDEFITFEQLATCEMFMERIAGSSERALSEDAP
jgi:acetylornithine deacetylase